MRRTWERWSADMAEKAKALDRAANVVERSVLELPDSYVSLGAFGDEALAEAVDQISAVRDGRALALRERARNIRSMVRIARSLGNPLRSQMLRAVSTANNDEQRKAVRALGKRWFDAARARGLYRSVHWRAEQYDRLDTIIEGARLYAAQRRRDARR